MFRDPTNPLLPNWKHIPVGYHGRASSIIVSGQDVIRPKGQVLPLNEETPVFQASSRVDFELEMGFVIGKKSNLGQSISTKEAEEYIFGKILFNDWSARDLQREEMPMSLGPAKGKDFASSFGPYMVTPDELEDAWDDKGKLHLRMTCHVNGKLISDGNTNDLYHSFGDMIERASMNTNLVPGEYIGSGTVGTGCILELRPENTGGWIQKGDTVTLEVELSLIHI